jgi:anti-sigma factor RsiW
MRAHLEGCPACREEHESLRALLAADGGLPG